MAIEVVGLTWLGKLLLATGFVGMAVLLYQYLDKGQIQTGETMTKVAGLLIVGMLFVGATYFFQGAFFYETETVTERDRPSEISYPEGAFDPNYGYIGVNTLDARAEADPELSGVTVSITEQDPSQNGELYLTENTVDEQGWIKTNDKTSGEVYGVFSKDGYYSNVEETTIPGAGVRPSPDDYMISEQYPIDTDPSISVSDNKGHVDHSGSTLTVDNGAGTVEFVLELEVEDSENVLMDPMVTMTRGSEFENVNGLDVVPSATADDIGEVTKDGDVTLDDYPVGTVEWTGIQKWGETVELKIKVDFEDVTGSLFEIELDDLHGEDVLRRPGDGAWDGVTISVEASNVI